MRNFSLSSLAKWLKPRSSRNRLPVSGPVSQITEGPLDIIPRQWAFLPKLEVIWSSVPIKVPKHTSVALRTVSKLVQVLWSDEHNDWKHFNRGAVCLLNLISLMLIFLYVLVFYLHFYSNSFYYIVKKMYLKLQIKAILYLEVKFFQS